MHFLLQVLIFYMIYVSILYLQCCCTNFNFSVISCHIKVRLFNLSKVLIFKRIKTKKCFQKSISLVNIHGRVSYIRIFMNTCICKMFVICQFLITLQKSEHLQIDFCNKLLHIFNLCVIVITYSYSNSVLQLILICYMHPQLSLTKYGSMINLWSVFFRAHQLCRSRRVLLDGPILSDHLFTLSLQFGQRFHKDWMNIDIIFYPWVILWTKLSFFFPNIKDIWRNICPFHIFFASQK